MQSEESLSILSPRLKVAIPYYQTILPLPHVWVMTTSYTSICTGFWTQIVGCHSVLSNYINLTSCLGDGIKLYQHLCGK
jgi:hypothetical protein